MKILILLSVLFSSSAYSQESRARQYGNNGQVNVTDPYKETVGNRRYSRHDVNQREVKAKLAEYLGEDYVPKNGKDTSTK